MLIGLWLFSKILLCFSAAILAFVNFVFAVFLAANMVAFFLIDMRFPFGDFCGDFFFVNRLGAADGRVVVVIGDTLIVVFATGKTGSMSSIDVEVPCCGCVAAASHDAGDGPGALWMSVASCGLFVAGFSIRAAFVAWAFSAKQNFSILRLFLSHSPTVLHATKLMRRGFGSGGLGRSFGRDSKIVVTDYCVFSVICIDSYGMGV